MKYRHYDNGVLVPSYVFSDKKYRLYDVDRYAQIASRSVPILKQDLNVPDDFKLILKPVRSKQYHGYYVDEDRTAIVDPRRRLSTFVTTIVHEMVHAQQYHEGRLELKYTKRSGWKYWWNGRVSEHQGESMSTYLRQPWEVEALELQDILALFVCDELGIELK